MEMAALAASKLDLSTQDADVIAETVTRLFGHHVMLSCGRADGMRRVLARPVSDILVGNLRYASNMTCIADEPRTRLCLTVPTECSGYMGKTLYAPGDVLAFNPEWVGRLELSAPGNFLNTCITEEHVLSGLRALMGVEPDGLPVFSAHLPAGSKVAEHLLAVLRILHESHGESAVLCRARESWALMEILSAWPHSYSTRLSCDTRRPRTLRRALDFIESHLDRPISVVDVALAASVGVRALNEAFHNHLDETPGRYIRGRRLDAARLALQVNDSCSVSEASTRWQFSNPGAFARYFRQRFGCLPGELRRQMGH